MLKKQLFLIKLFRCNWFILVISEGEKVEVIEIHCVLKKRDGVFEIPATAEMQVVNIFINELEESVQA